MLLRNAQSGSRVHTAKLRSPEQQHQAETCAHDYFTADFNSICACDGLVHLQGCDELSAGGG
jgi:hypothetical protein